jgi:hypothetical protein
VHAIDPGAGQIGQGGKIGPAAQPCGLEASHLAARCGITIHPAAIHHGPHRGIIGQSVGVVDIFVAGEAAENRLAKQAGRQMAGVLAAPSIRQRPPGEIGQRKGVVEFAVGQQTGVGSDPAAVELRPQAAVEIDPQGTIIRFTRWVFHAREPRPPTTCCKSWRIRRSRTGNTGFIREMRV